MEFISQNLPVLITTLPLFFAAVSALLSNRQFAVVAFTANNFIVFCLCLLAVSKTGYGAAITYDMGDWVPPYGIEHRITNGKALLLTVIWAVSFITAPLSYKMINHDIEKKRGALFYSCTLLALAGLSGMVLANDIFNIYVFLEISSLAMYALVASGKRKKALVAAYNYLIMGTIAGSFVLLGIAILYAETGSLNLSDIKFVVADNVANFNKSSINLAFAALFLGLALKSALFPLAAWLPAVYKYSPIYVVVLLSAFATKVAFFVLIQFISIFKLTDLWTLELRYIIMAMAVFGMVYSSIKACCRGEVRTILAYSSIANISYILVAVALDNTIAYAAAFYHIFFHGLTKAGLYSLISSQINEKGLVKLSALKGMAYNKAFKAGLFVVLTLALVGVPGMAIFFSKWLLIKSSLDTNIYMGFIVIAAVLISSFLSVIYMWRIIEAIFSREAGDQKNKEQGVDLIAITVLLLVLPSIYFGLNSTEIFSYAKMVLEGAM